MFCTSYLFLSGITVNQLPYCSLDLAVYLRWLKGTFSFSSKYSGDEKLWLNATIISNKYYVSYNCDIMIIFTWEKEERDKSPEPDFLSGSFWETRKRNLEFHSWSPGPRHDAVCPAEGALDYQKGICGSNSTEWSTPPDAGISAFCSLPSTGAALRPIGLLLSKRTCVLVEKAGHLFRCLGHHILSDVDGKREGY